MQLYMHMRNAAIYARADWGAMCAALAGRSGKALPVNTAEETRSALAEIREPALRCYTDGGCDGNGAGYGNPVVACAAFSGP